MKYLLFIFVLFLGTFTAGAQWQPQAVNTKAGLRGLSVVSEKIIWASGTGGTFLKTIDGGATWKVGTVPDAQKLDFRDVEAFDANTAYLLSIGNGESSRIYKTTDGGETWKMQFKSTNEKVFLDALAFWDKNNGIAMSDPVDGYYYLLTTTDGGATWKPAGTAKMPAAMADEAAFAASGTCLIVNGRTGRISRNRRQRRAGFSHGEPRPELDRRRYTDRKRHERQRYFLDSHARFEKRGYRRRQLRKTDRDRLITSPLPRTAERHGKPAAGLPGYRSGVAYIDKQTIIAVGSTGSDISTDGGKTWKNLDKVSYNAVQAKGKRAIWGVGDKGMVARLVQ